MRRSPPVIALTGLVALAVPMGIGRFAFTPILPMMQVDAGLSLTAAGWLASVNYVGTLVGALAAVAIPARAAPAIRAGLLAIGLVTLQMAIERGVAGWTVLRLIAGIATGWVLPLASAWALERLTPLRRPILNATVFGGYGAGIIAAGATCLVLMHARASSAQAWTTLGVLALGATAIVWPILDAPRPAMSGAEFRPARYDARLILCYGAFGFGYIIPATFLPVMARRAVADPAIFGWAWPFFGAAAAASTFACAGLARSLGNRRLWSLGHVVMAGGVVLPVLWSGIIAIMLSALLVGATFTVITMAGFQEGREVGGVRMIAAMASAFAFGQIAGPIVVTAVVRPDGGFSEALVSACVLLLVSAWAVYTRHGRGSPPRFFRKLR